MTSFSDIENQIGAISKSLSASRANAKNLDDAAEKITKSFSQARESATSLSSKLSSLKLPPSFLTQSGPLKIFDEQLKRAQTTQDNYRKSQKELISAQEALQANLKKQKRLTESIAAETDLATRRRLETSLRFEVEEYQEAAKKESKLYQDVIELSKRAKGHQLQPALLDDLAYRQVTAVTRLAELKFAFFVTGVQTATAQFHEMRQQLAEADYSLKSQLKTLSDIYKVQLKTGLAHKTVVEAQKSLVARGLEHLADNRENVKTVGMLSDTLNVSVDSSSELLALSKNIGTSFARVGSAVSFVAKETGTSAAQAMQLASSIARIRQTFTNAPVDISKVTIAAGMIQGAFNEIGGQGSELVDLLRTLGSQQGVGLAALTGQGAGIFGQAKYLENAEDLFNVVDQMQAKVAGMPKYFQRQFLISMGVSDQTATMILSLSKTRLEQLRKESRVISEDAKWKDDLTRRYAEQSSSFSKALERLGSSVQATFGLLLMPLLTQLTKGLELAASGISGTMRALDQIPAWLKKVGSVAALTFSAVALGTITWALGRVTFAFISLTRALWSLLPAITAVSNQISGTGGDLIARRARAAARKATGRGAVKSATMAKGAVEVAEVAGAAAATKAAAKSSAVSRVWTQVVSISSGSLSKVWDRVATGLPAVGRAGQLFKSGAGSLGKLLSGLAPLTKSLGGVLGKIGGVGLLLMSLIDLFSDLSWSNFFAVVIKTVTTAALGWLGTALGSIVPVFGNIAGGIIGAAAGATLGDWLNDLLGLTKKKEANKMPEAEKKQQTALANLEQATNAVLASVQQGRYTDALRLIAERSAAGSSDEEKKLIRQRLESTYAMAASENVKVSGSGTYSMPVASAAGIENVRAARAIVKEVLGPLERIEAATLAADQNNVKAQQQLAQAQLMQGRMSDLTGSVASSDRPDRNQFVH